ncbi:MAG TPA: penicillin-binding protein activator [Xanthobacteraceae bacterium]|nr:penicillin-binding protein activator [Xanthobacteraceae bacterium]
MSISLLSAGRRPAAGRSLRLRAWHYLRGLAGLAGALALAACGGGMSDAPPPAAMLPPPAAPIAAAPANSLGTGTVRIGLILPLSASGNAAAAAQAMRNAADMALAEFAGADLQILVKDDGGTAQGAQAAAQAAIDEGARALLGPLFAHSVAAAGQVARNAGVPLVGFSTDANVAARGTYLLSFLPETDVNRVVRYAASQGRRSFAALLPENAYGSVVEAAFQQAVPAAGGRVVAIDRYPPDRAKFAESARRLATSAGSADAIFLPDAADAVPELVKLLAANGVKMASVQLLGTGLWDDPRLLGDPVMAGGLFAAPDPAGYRAFSQRYRARFNQAPVRTASLAHDGVSLMAAIVKTQGAAGLTDAGITSPSGFNGVDGIFRFKSDGTNERGLAVMQIEAGTTRIVSPAPRSFTGAGL